MKTTTQVAAEAPQAEIEQLEARLAVLLSETPAMDDEINAVERDLDALRRKLASAQ